MNDFRCKNCGHLLCKEEVLFGQIEIKCYACNEMNVLSYEYEVLKKSTIYTAEVVPSI
jgi:phage FluMu protein Com